MRQQVAFIMLFCILRFAAYAQVTNTGKPALSQIQKWQLNAYRQFLNNANINVLKESSIDQFTKALQTCNATCTNSTLPVRDLKLEGERVSASLVKLKFSTLGEFNNAGFVIERQYDNSIRGFDSVGFVKSRGDFTGKTNYSFQDDNAYDKYSFYRLRQIDTDGRFTFSKTIKISGYSGQPSLKVVPNPATSENIFIRLSGFKKQDGIKLAISDATGSLVYKSGISTMSGNNYRLQGIHLASGVYYIKIYNNNDEHAFTTFIVQ